MKILFKLDSKQKNANENIPFPLIPFAKFLNINDM